MLPLVQRAWVSSWRTRATDARHRYLAPIETRHNVLSSRSGRVVANDPVSSKELGSAELQQQAILLRSLEWLVASRVFTTVGGIAPVGWPLPCFPTHGSLDVPSVRDARCSRRGGFGRNVPAAWGSSRDVLPPSVLPGPSGSFLVRVAKLHRARLLPSNSS